jgi:hypothetical protein
MAYRLSNWEALLNRIDTLADKASSAGLYPIYLHFFQVFKGPGVPLVVYIIFIYILEKPLR